MCYCYAVLLPVPVPVLVPVLMPVLMPVPVPVPVPVLVPVPVPVPVPVLVLACTCAVLLCLYHAVLHSYTKMNNVLLFCVQVQIVMQQLPKSIIERGREVTKDIEVQTQNVRRKGS